jgi:hypothetical protein
MRRQLSLLSQGRARLPLSAPFLVAGLLLATTGQGAMAAAPASSGQRLWVHQYNGPGDGSDYAYDLGLSPNGSTLFVTGTSSGVTSSYDYATIAYDTATGATVWTSRHDGPDNSFDSAHALGVSPDGSMVFVTGSATADAFPDYETIAYDAATGTELWVSRYTGPGDVWDDANALGISPDGSMVFVTGSSYGQGFTSADYATVAYEAATGEELWVSRYNGPGSNTDSAHSLGVSPDGSTVFVTGYSYGAAFDAGYATLAYDAATGTELWASRYDGPGGFDIALDLGIRPDGSALFVTGHSIGVASSQDYATVAYDPVTGAEVWVSRYDGPRSRPDYCYALAVSPDGSTVFVTGKSHGLTDDDYATVAYDPVTGAEVWVSRYNGTGNGADSAYALDVSPDSSTVFVTGTAVGASDSDYTTVAYEAATGTNLWRRMDGRGGSDTPNELGVSPDGSTVFVTGALQATLGGKYNYATMAFAT